MIAPVFNPKVTSEFGEARNFPPFGPHTHDGIDWVDRSGDRRVRAIAPGRVILDFDDYDPRLAWTDGRHSLGNYVIVQHGLSGLYFVRYCHLDQNFVKHNQEVPEGFVLGTYSNAGMSVGAHTHTDTYNAAWIKGNIAAPLTAAGINCKRDRV